MRVLVPHRVDLDNGTALVRTKSDMHCRGDKQHLGVLHEFGEAQLEVVLDVEVEQIVGDVCGGRPQEGH